jgi:CRP/FNR family cyclic AMP-dependent transcriptional regulator
MDRPSKHREAATDAVLELLSRPEFGDVTTAEFNAHQVLFEPSQPADRIFYLLSGEVRISQSVDGSTERLVAIQGRGSWIGLAPLANQASYGFRALAHRPSTILIVPAPTFFKLIDTAHEVASGIVCQLASRLLKSCTVATRLSLQNSDTRIIQTLLDLGSSAAAFPDDDDVVLQMTHQELAQAVGVARETVSVALIALRRHHLVRTKRNRMSFNPQVLRQFVESKSTLKKRAK